MSYYKTVNTLSDVDAAYIVGLIDGDGSILLFKDTKEIIDS